MHASYDRTVDAMQHHWMGMPEDISKYFGFVYKMTSRETGQQYIGSKQFLFWDGPRGGYKCTTPTDKEFFDRSLWRHSDWPLYTSSSKVVNGMIGDEPWKFEYEVLHLANSKLDLHLLEIKEHVDRNVLEALNEEGKYQYLNENIMGVEYRPPVPRAELYAAKAEAEKKLRDYYLRPNVCKECGKAIPYGAHKCCTKYEQILGS